MLAVKLERRKLQQHPSLGFRNNRKDALDMLKSLKEDGLSEDMMKDGEGEIQNITNAFTRKVEDILVAKELDIMTI